MEFLFSRRHCLFEKLRNYESQVCRLLVYADHGQKELRRRYGGINVDRWASWRRQTSSGRGRLCKVWRDTEEKELRLVYQRQAWPSSSIPS